MGHLILLASTCERVLNPPHFWASKGLTALVPFCGAIHAAFLKSPITNKRITALITALMIAATMPPTRTNPIRGKASQQSRRR